MSVANFPATQTVDGTVTVNGTTSLSGTVSVQGIGTAGTDYTTNVLSIQGVSGGVSLPVSMGEVSTGAVLEYSSASSVASSSSAVVTYHSVSNGTTFYVKNVIASASSGPVKVLVEYAAASTGASGGTYAVGFFSSANPTVDLSFKQPIAVAGPTFVRVTMRNDALSAQDLYATITGHTI